MSLIGWLLFGLIAGFIASKIVTGRGSGCAINTVLGIVGACVGGFVFSSLGHPVWFHFSLGSMVVAVIGAVVVLFMFHGIERHR